MIKEISLCDALVIGCDRGLIGFHRVDNEKKLLSLFNILSWPHSTTWM